MPPPAESGALRKFNELQLPVLSVALKLRDTLFVTLFEGPAGSFVSKRKSAPPDPGTLSAVVTAQELGEKTLKVTD